MAAETVQAGLAQGQLDKECVAIEQHELEEMEELIQKFAQDGCKCDFGSNKSPCCTTISLEHFQSVRCQMAELTNDELDLVVMGQVMAGYFTGKISSHHGQERGKFYTVFYHQGVKICQKTFLFLHTISYGRFKAIKASYHTRGVAARVHGNKGKSTKLRLSLKEIQDVVQYVMNYAGVYVCSEMGRVSECMCMCVCKRERERERTLLYKRHYVHMHVHRYLYKSVCDLRRYQCDFAARACTRLQGRRCEVAAIQHNQALHLGALSPSYSS